MGILELVLLLLLDLECNYWKEKFILVFWSEWRGHTKFPVWKDLKAPFGSSLEQFNQIRRPAVFTTRQLRIARVFNPRTNTSKKRTEQLFQEAVV